jgi:hypothetical protein
MEKEAERLIILPAITARQFSGNKNLYSSTFFTSFELERIGC